VAEEVGEALCNFSRATAAGQREAREAEGLTANQPLAPCGPRLGILDSWNGALDSSGRSAGRRRRAGNGMQTPNAAFLTVNGKVDAAFCIADSVVHQALRESCTPLGVIVRQLIRGRVCCPGCKPQQCLPRFGTPGISGHADPCPSL
jgi:hypothetical protein